MERWKGSFASRLAVAGTMVLLSAAAFGQTQVVDTEQTLDRAVVFSLTDGLSMTFNDPDRGSKSFDNLELRLSSDPPIKPAALSTCTLSTADGLFCLDGEIVRQWPKLSDGSGELPLFHCDQVPGLDKKSTQTCTGMTIEQQGGQLSAIWVAGKDNGKAHSLVKVVVVAKNASGSCPASSFTGLDGRCYQATPWASGRPLLVDVNHVPSEAGFALGEGILGLEQRKMVVFFDGLTAGKWTEIASGKSGWNLEPREELQSVALLKLEGGDFVLVTTSFGRIKARNAADPSAQVFEAFKASTDLELGSGDLANGSCPDGAIPAAQYALRTSSRADVVYVSDRQRCMSYALRPSPSATAGTFRLVRATDPETSESVPVLSTGSNAPEGITLAPGIGIDLRPCSDTAGDTCEVPLIKGAALSGVTVVSEESGMILFQVQGIPDCRWIDPEPEACDVPGVVVDPDNTGERSAQYLNVYPLLPREVLDVLEDRGLPKDGAKTLLISPQYRGQDRGSSADSFYFDAFVAITEPNVRFAGVFEGEFKVDELTNNRNLDCKLPATRDRNEFAALASDDAKLQYLLEWDVVTRVSEHFLSADGQEWNISAQGGGQGHNYVDALVNNGCGSSRAVFPSMSVLPYHLEITPDTYHPDRPAGQKVVTNNDAVFARLVLKLFDDLVYVTNELTCVAGKDGPTSRPYSTEACDTLKAALANAGDKLGKCVAATYQPKTSAGNQNCTSFDQQWATFRATLDAINGMTVAIDDPANRRGELEARSQTIQHVYAERFVPTIPAGGYRCEAAGGC